MCMIAWLCELLVTNTLSLVVSLINSMSFVLCNQKLMASGKHGRAQEEPALEDPAELMGILREMVYATSE